MTVTLVAAGDTACTLHERTDSCTTQLTLPVPKAGLITLLRTLLADRDKRQVESAPVMVERMRDGLRIHLGASNFTVSWSDVFPVLES